MSPTETAAPKRDARIDRIGFAGELTKHFIDPLKKTVKASHPDPGTRLTADYFDALIVGGESTSIDPSDWLHLLNTGKIDRKQFCSAIRVSTETAREVLDAKTFERIADSKPAPIKLVVSRQKDVEASLINALRHVRSAFDESIPTLKAA